MCNPRPSGVIYPTCPHSRITHESKVNLILEPDAAADTGSRSRFRYRPQQRTSFCKATSACQVKSITAREKNASGSVGLLKHSHASELGKKHNAGESPRRAERAEPRIHLRRGLSSPSPSLSLAIFADFIQGRSSHIFR